MSIVLVTGTGTDIGKTIGTAALAAALREEGKEVHVVKPIQTGFPGPDGGDLDTVAELTGIDNLHGFERYPEPMAPVAAVIIAGRPPVNEIVIAMMTVANSPTAGSTPARMEKAMDSGINASATVMPANTSVRRRAGEENA